MSFTSRGQNSIRLLKNLSIAAFMMSFNQIFPKIVYQTNLFKFQFSCIAIIIIINVMQGRIKWTNKSFHAIFAKATAQKFSPAITSYQTYSILPYNKKACPCWNNKENNLVQPEQEPIAPPGIDQQVMQAKIELHIMRF